MDSLEAIVTLNMLPKIGPVRSQALIKHCGSPQAVFEAPTTQLNQVKGIGTETSQIIQNWQQFADPKKELAEAEERGISIITQADSDYPQPLRDIHEAPLVLYVWGKLIEEDNHALAIVGSRKTTRYGRDQGHKFAYQLARNGYTIVSGLARGIDTTAHEGAIAANGRTIAVIGSGLTQIYPPENMPLAERIANGYGAVISEFPLHTPPDKKTFPQRNRIVAGWTKGILVVECPQRSGSLITANMAADQGKHLFAIPGQIDHPSSSGCNELIRDGATLVSDPGQILEELQTLSFKKSTPSSPSKPNEKKAPPILDITPEERVILDALEQGEAHVDQLSEQTNFPVQEISTLLLKLELDGHVHAQSGMRYARAYEA